MMGVLLGLLVSLAFAGVIYRQYKQLRQVQQNLEQLLTLSAKHQLEQSALVNADLVFSKQLNDINKQLVSMDNQLQALETKRGNDGGYQHALRILEMGGNKEEIINNCHLSNAEAELLMNLHAYRAAIKVSPG